MSCSAFDAVIYEAPLGVVHTAVELRCPITAVLVNGAHVVRLFHGLGSLAIPRLEPPILLIRSLESDIPSDAVLIKSM